MRGVRKAVKKVFKAAGFGKGKHKWEPTRWIKEITHFVSKISIKHNACEKHSLCLLLYHAYGRTYKKIAKSLTREVKKEANSTIYNGLGRTKILREERLFRYHGIFENNNQKDREDFFKDPLIRKLWEVALPFMTKEVFFKKDAVMMENEFTTFCWVTTVIMEHFKLPLPEWWQRMFPKINLI
jgi:hypothetical protein